MLRRKFIKLAGAASTTIPFTGDITQKEDVQNTDITGVYNITLLPVDETKVKEEPEDAKGHPVIEQAISDARWVGGGTLPRAIPKSNFQGITKVRGNYYRPKVIEHGDVDKQEAKEIIQKQPRIETPNR